MQEYTADRILQKAHALIADLGYSGFSYADVSEAVQIRKASIHHHFPTKADLVGAVLQAHREKLVQGTRALDEQLEDPFARLQAYVRHWEGCIRGKKESFCVAALLAAEVPGLPKEVRHEIQQHFQELSAWIRRTLEAGVRQRTVKLQGTAEDEAQTFMAVVHGAFRHTRRERSRRALHKAGRVQIRRVS